MIHKMTVTTDKADGTTEINTYRVATQDLDWQREQFRLAGKQGETTTITVK